MNRRSFLKSLAGAVVTAVAKPAVFLDPGPDLETIRHLAFEDFYYFAANVIVVNPRMNFKLSGFTVPEEP